MSHAARARDTVQANLDALDAILRWNAEMGIGCFRISQQLIPFASHPAFPYDWEHEHGPALTQLGALAARLGIRLSMHPGQFIQPGSPNLEVRDRSLAELRYVARVLALIGGADLVLHLGGAFGNPQAAVDRFCRSLDGENEILTYLALENDERLWTVAALLDAARSLGVPLIVDTLHHALNPGELDLHDALTVAFPTWQRTPKMHLSSQDPTKRPGAHAWGVTPEDHAALLAALGPHATDVMVEAKGKEAAVLPLLDRALPGIEVPSPTVIASRDPALIMST